MEDTRKALYANFDLRIHGTQVEIEMRMLVEITWCEFKMQLTEVEVQAGSYGRTGTDIGAAQPPKFDESTSWAMF